TSRAVVGRGDYWPVYSCRAEPFIGQLVGQGQGSVESEVGFDSGEPLAGPGRQGGKHALIHLLRLLPFRPGVALQVADGLADALVSLLGRGAPTAIVNPQRLPLPVGAQELDRPDGVRDTRQPLEQFSPTPASLELLEKIRGPKAAAVARLVPEGNEGADGGF